MILGQHVIAALLFLGSNQIKLYPDRAEQRLLDYFLGYHSQIIRKNTILLIDRGCGWKNLHSIISCCISGKVQKICCIKSKALLLKSNFLNIYLFILIWVFLEVETAQKLKQNEKI